MNPEWTSTARRPGLRIGEALGLRWCDVNFDAGLLHVRQQLSRRRTPKQLKTPAAQREVVLAGIPRAERAVAHVDAVGGGGGARARSGERRDGGRHGTVPRQGT